MLIKIPQHAYGAHMCKGTLITINMMLGGDPLKDSGLLNKSNPISNISDNTPPFLLFYGTGDTLVPLSQGQLMYEALKAKDKEVQLIEIKDALHTGVEFFQKDTWEIIYKFFKEKLV